MIKRIIPHPLLSLALVLMWLFLTGSFAAKSILFAVILGLAAPFGLRLLEPEKVSIRNPRAICQLLWFVLKDIVRSNIAVTAIILGRKREVHISGFVQIPLTLKSPYGLSVLAIILTSTPGTLWVQYDSGRQRLLLHVLDLVDEKEWIDLIQGRYERLLKEIFE